MSSSRPPAGKAHASAGWVHRLDLSPEVAFTSIGVIAIFLGFGVAFTEEAGRLFTATQAFITSRFGWLYVGAVASFLVFTIALLVSPLSRVRLGPDESKPDFSNASWFAMLFSAGMGIGLVFFSVAEPMAHFAEPPLGPGGTEAAARDAMRITLFHWGIHAWAIYAVVGMSLAYFSFRKGLPLSIRSTLHPLLGERIHGPVGHAVDILAIFGTMFGVATSLGLGVMQVNAGLDRVFSIPFSTGAQILLIAGITAVATGSVVLGIDRGIRRLSNVNIVFAATLMTFVFLSGPSVRLLGAWLENVGGYAGSLVEATFWLDVWGDGEWMGSWTLFYWGWWIAWSPFVGMFIARISRGRTIREFIAGVLLAPVAVSTLWMTVFGNSALFREREAPGGFAGAAQEEMLFALLDGLPLSPLTSTVAIVVVILFFVTSSDSGSLVIDMLASGGNPNPAKIQRVFWAVTEGAVATVLLLAGGLNALQAAAIGTGLPFTPVLLVMCWCLWRALRSEPPLPDRVARLQRGSHRSET